MPTELETIVRVSDFENAMQGFDKINVALGRTGSAASAARNVYYVDDMTIYISGEYASNGTLSTTGCIPQRIVGYD